MPPSAARAPPSAHTTLTTRSTSMPDDAARSGLSATARVALPSLVYCRNRATSTSTMTDMPMTQKSFGARGWGRCRRRPGSRSRCRGAPTRRRGTGSSCGRSSDRPIETIIMAIRLMPRRRNGRQSTRSSSAPDRPPTTMATRVAGRRCIPQRTLAYQATMAPQVTISPWAKLVSPVVPKISDRPTAQRAMTRPNLMPSKMSCGTRSRSLSEARSRAPRSKIRGRLWPGSTSTSRRSSPSARPTPSGSESTSRTAM